MKMSGHWLVRIFLKKKKKNFPTLSAPTRFHSFVLNAPSSFNQARPYQLYINEISLSADGWGWDFNARSGVSGFEHFLLIKKSVKKRKKSQLVTYIF